MVSPPKWCILFLFILKFVDSLPIFHTTKLVCPSSTQCECSQGSEYELACPRRINPNIIVRVEQHQQSNRVEIECNTIDDNFYTNLPEWNIGNAHMVKLSGCPLSSSKTIERIVNRLGIREIHTVTVSISAKKLIDSENSTQIEQLPEDIFNSLRKVSSLNLLASGISLTQNIFGKLHELEFLELGFNNLSKLEAGIFRNQSKLKRLNLWGNNLRNLTKEWFAGASSVTDLDLSANNIEVLQPNVFENFINMTAINLNSNRFSYLPEGLFKANKNLQKISLIDNRNDMKTLPNNFLAHLPHLQYVIISCNMQQTPDNLFNESNHLRNISLASNALAFIPKHLLQNKSNLINLDISHNQLIQLDDDTFNATVNLIVLRLSHNQLTSISRKLVSGLRKLKELYIDDNHLHSIHMAAFENTNLHTLYLQNNFLDITNIERIPMDAERVSPFENLFDLEVLNLRNNSIKHFLNDWSMNNAALKSLDLSFNKIDQLNFVNIFMNWAGPIEINLANNRITTIIFDKYEREKIKQATSTWHLNHNPLKCDCLIMHFASYLHSGRGAANDSRIKFVADGLKCASPSHFVSRAPDEISLKDLICTLDNENTTDKICPSDCSCHVRTVDSTAVFNCSNANLTRVPELPDIKSLGLRHYELHIENNNISYLPLATTIGYQNLNRIYARNNFIEHLMPENLPNDLHALDLSMNNLKELNVSVLWRLAYMEKLENVSLGHNPWHCDCGSFELLRSIQTHYAKVFDFNEIRCNNRDNQILIYTSDLCPAERSMISIILIGIFILLLLLSTTLYYKYKREIMVWLFAHNDCWWLFRQKIDATESHKPFDAFVLYSTNDGQSVADNLVSELENGAPPLKICLLTRESKAGDILPDQIAKCVESSRRTIVVLTPKFIETFSKINMNQNQPDIDASIDIWGLMGFRVAHKHALDERRTRVLIVTSGDIGNIDHFDPELKAYLKTNINLKWKKDRMFFRKLRLALANPYLYSLSK